jgi:asparagine synthetase B (glutamine-hydrolysing)
MCGILAVKGAGIPLSTHLQALSHLERRGPDFTKYRYEHGIFIAQTVLHITGSDSCYHNPTDQNFVSFNGEIYNYQRLGDFACDTELVVQAATRDHSLFSQFEGPWAWVKTDFHNLSYAADPQGERCLYHYRDNDILIVASEVTAILEYIRPRLQTIPYLNKGWTMIDKTPWAGITRVTPGVMYQDGYPVKSLDSIWSWVRPDRTTQHEAQEEFQRIWTQVCTDIAPNEPASISFSGGIDSGLILASIPDLEPVTIDCVGKDPVVLQTEEFLNNYQLAHQRKISIDTKTWAAEYQALIRQTRMPAQSWSHVGKWLVARESRRRIVFTGLAADELFGGYDQYLTMLYSQNTSTSQYSHNDHDHLWHRCLDAYLGDARSATLLMDYWYQVVGVDAPGHDRLGGAWGKETRNPFMHQRVMKFALNLPFSLRVNAVTKPLVRNEFLRHWPERLIKPKTGFAGHANDSLPWLSVSIDATGDRQADWKQIAQRTFYDYVT